MEELERLCRAAYGAYEFLRDHDLSAESGTSKRMRSDEVDKLQARLVEELGELRGVIEGTHRHEGFDRDIILEGYEVWYWAACWMAAQGFTYAVIQPHISLEEGFNYPPTSREELLELGQKLIQQLTPKPADWETALGLCHQALKFVGMACSLNRTDPARLIDRDVKEMRQKNYLAAYWQASLGIT